MAVCTALYEGSRSHAIKSKPGSPRPYYSYRAVHVPTLEQTNPLYLVANYIPQNDMFQQSLTVVAGRKGGFILLNTQGKPDSENHPTNRT